MKKVMMLGACLAAMLAAPSVASAETFELGSPNFTASPGPDGTYNAMLGNKGIAAGDFSDVFTFTVPDTGFGSGTVSTSASIFGSPNDLDFTSVTINDVAANITRTDGGLYEVAFANMVPITAGVLNRLTVTGVSRGGGAYGGQLSFIPSAVPEPAAWAMMILGVAMVGGAMRTRRKSALVAA